MNPFEDSNSSLGGALHPIPNDWRAKLSYGANKEAKKGEWKSHEITLSALEQGLTTHVVGSKDGRCFLQGTCAGGHRIARAMEALYIIGIDVDNGMPSDEIDRIIRDRGLYAIRYTTHSHGKAYTEVRQNDWIKFERTNPGATIGEYLQAKKRYLPEIASNARIEGEELTSNGLVLRVAHAPMDKNRIVFILAKPWRLNDFTSAGKTQDEAIRAWKDAYLNFAAWLGIPVDESCTDPSRLFYTPRYERGAPFEAVVHRGQAINIFDLPPAASKPATNLFTDAAASMGAGSGEQSDIMRQLKRWAAMGYKDRFLIYDALADHAEHVLRPDKDTEGKHHIECPFEDEHSEIGGYGTFVMNAGESNKGSFVIRCQHNSCQSRQDALVHLAAMIEKEWLPPDVLYDDRYLIETVEEPNTRRPAPTQNQTVPQQPPAQPQPPKQWTAPPASSFVGMSIEDAEAQLRQMAEDDVSDLKVEQMLEILTKATGMAKTALVKTYGRFRQDVKRRRKEEEAQRAAEELAREKAKAELQRATEAQNLNLSQDRPTLYVDTDFLLAASKALKALEDSNRDNIRIFRFAGGLARVIEDEYGLKCAQRYDTKSMRYELTRVVRFMRENGETFREVAPPTEVVDDIMSEADPPFPPLYGICNAPVFGRDGKLLTAPGYSHSSQLYFAQPANFTLPPVSRNPSREEVARALDLLLGNSLVDFPFDGPNAGEAERAHALCMILQPFVRQLIDGPTPIYLVAKPTPGTGASKLIGIYSLIAHGELAIAQTEAKQEDEIRKRITSVLAEGRNTFYLDNVNFKVDSSALASAVTSEMWTDRLLGETKTVRVPVRLTWIIAGNNPMLSNEIARRCVRIRLDAKVERPEERRGFKHADLEGWVKENRGILVWACLTLIQRWIADGRPPPERVKGSFEAWSNVMGGILRSVGVGGFLGNEEEMRADADEEGRAIKSYLALWWDKYRDQPTTIGGDSMDEGLAGLIEETDAPLPVYGNSERAVKISLGKYLAKLKGRLFTLNDGTNNVSVEIVQMPAYQGTTRWRLRPVT